MTVHVSRILFLKWNLLFLSIDLIEMHRELKRKGMTKQLLWEESTVRRTLTTPTVIPSTVIATASGERNRNVPCGRYTRLVKNCSLTTPESRYLSLIVQRVKPGRHRSLLPCPVLQATPMPKPAEVNPRPTSWPLMSGHSFFLVACLRCRYQIMHDELDSVAMTPLLGVLAGHRQYLSESFMEFIHHWQSEAHDSQDSESDFSLEDLNKSCQAMLEEIPDEFTFASVWQDQMGFMPPEGISLIGQQILSLDNPRYGDFLSLLVLDEQEKSAVAIADLLANHPKAITPLTLERMIRIRNWLPKAVQTLIDKLIKNVRKLGVCPSGKKVSTDGEIQAWMTSVDGSGAQGVMIMVNDINHPQAFRLVNFVLKEAVGIVDISVSPPETRKKLQHIITSTKQHGVPLEKVSSELIRKLIPPFMALNLSSKTCLSADMLEGMELLGLDNWNPASAQFETLSPELLSFNTPPSDQEIASVQKRSVSWTNSAFADSWLISDAFTITGGTVKKMISDVCDQVLEPKKGLWRERMQRMCLWANACESMQRQKQARDFAVVSWLLEQDMPASQIKLLESIVKKSL